MPADQAVPPRPFSIPLDDIQVGGVRWQEQQLGVQL